MLIISVISTTHRTDADSKNEELDELLARVGDGDREAFTEMYGRTRAAVYAMALSYLKNAADAEDMTQDTFVRVWQSAAGYKAKGSPMAWILTIARNLSLMELRRRTRVGEITEDEWNAIPADSPRVTAEDKIVLENALGTLSDDERRVVLLHASSGMKHREIAKLLDLPLSTVISRYNRAVRKLQKELGKEPTDS